MQTPLPGTLAEAVQTRLGALNADWRRSLMAGSPPDVTAKKYGDASSALTSAGFQPVVSTTVGDRKSWPECIVTSVQARDKTPPANSGGSVTHLALVSLNCDAAAASATAPGYSAQSPEGKAIAAAASG